MRYVRDRGYQPQNGSRQDRQIDQMYLINDAHYKMRDAARKARKEGQLDKAEQFKRAEELADEKEAELTRRHEFVEHTRPDKYSSNEAVRAVEASLKRELAKTRYFQGKIQEGIPIAYPPGDRRVNIYGKHPAWRNMDLKNSLLTAALEELYEIDKFVTTPHVPTEVPPATFVEHPLGREHPLGQDPLTDGVAGRTRAGMKRFRGEGLAGGGVFLNPAHAKALELMRQANAHTGATLPEHRAAALAKFVYKKAYHREQAKAPADSETGEGFTDVKNWLLGRPRAQPTVTPGDVPVSEMAQMADAAYGDTPSGKQVGAFVLKDATPTLKFFVDENSKKVVVAVRGTYDARDVWADANIALGRLHKTGRYKEDESELRRFQTQFPPSEYEYHATGHSLGGAVADELISAGLIPSATTYNAAVQLKHALNPNHQNTRFYNDHDALGRLAKPFLEYANPEKTEYREAPEGKTSILGAHSMDQFIDPQPETEPETGTETETGNDTGGMLKRKRDRPLTDRDRAAAQIRTDIESLRVQRREILAELAELKKIPVVHRTLEQIERIDELDSREYDLKSQASQYVGLLNANEDRDPRLKPDIVNSFELPGRKFARSIASYYDQNEVLRRAHPDLPAHSFYKGRVADFEPTALDEDEIPKSVSAKRETARFVPHPLAHVSAGMYPGDLRGFAAKAHKGQFAFPRHAAQLRSWLLRNSDSDERKFVPVFVDDDKHQIAVGVNGPKHELLYFNSADDPRHDDIRTFMGQIAGEISTMKQDPSWKAVHETKWKGLPPGTKIEGTDFQGPYGTCTMWATQRIRHADKDIEEFSKWAHEAMARHNYIIEDWDGVPKYLSDKFIAESFHPDKEDEDAEGEHDDYTLSDLGGEGLCSCGCGLALTGGGKRTRFVKGLPEDPDKVREEYEASLTRPKPRRPRHRYVEGTRETADAGVDDLLAQAEQEVKVARKKARKELGEKAGTTLARYEHHDDEPGSDSESDDSDYVPPEDDDDEFSELEEDDSDGGSSYHSIEQALEDEDFEQFRALDTVRRHILAHPHLLEKTVADEVRATQRPLQLKDKRIMPMLEDGASRPRYLELEAGQKGKSRTTGQIVERVSKGHRLAEAYPLEAQQHAKVAQAVVRARGTERERQAPDTLAQKYFTAANQKRADYLRNFGIDLQTQRYVYNPNAAAGDYEKGKPLSKKHRTNATYHFAREQYKRLKRYGKAAEAEYLTRVPTEQLLKETAVEVMKYMKKLPKRAHQPSARLHIQDRHGSRSNPIDLTRDSGAIGTATGAVPFTPAQAAALRAALGVDAGHDSDATAPLD